MLIFFLWLLSTFISQVKFITDVITKFTFSMFTFTNCFSNIMIKCPLFTDINPVSIFSSTPLSPPPLLLIKILQLTSVSVNDSNQKNETTTYDQENCSSQKLRIMQRHFIQQCHFLTFIHSQTSPQFSSLCRFCPQFRFKLIY